MKLLIVTQVNENYAWREDGSIGTGTEAYWKPKGGCEYFVENVDVNQAAAVVEQVRDQIEESSDYFVEYIIDWEVVANDYMTEFERSQLEYEGRIDHPARVLEVA